MILNRYALASLPVLVVLLFSALAAAQTKHKYKQEDKFRQLEEILPTANPYRAASGAPGNAYWQQEVDYEIDVRIDDATQQLFGSEKIRYQNNSPDSLDYLWLQLDQNIRTPKSDSHLAYPAKPLDRMSYDGLKSTLVRTTFDGSIKVTECSDVASGQPLKHTIVKTMMRIDLPQSLASGQAIQFQIDWNYQICNAKEIWGRTGFEYFPDNDNYLYEIAQWFPRLCAYTDTTGWQHKQFLGRGEFALEFGNYLVRITMPSKHVVAATGDLINSGEVLTATQQQRLANAKTATDPVFIITPAEAKANAVSDEDALDEKNKGNASEKQDSAKNSKAADGLTAKTWIFKADRVRDFAFASSKNFIWDAMLQKAGEREVLAMSFYPNEAEPLWSKYSTRAVAHAVDVYSRFTFDYPYSVAISVNGPIYGMEYPMICFNGPRPEDDGTYSKRTKYALISVVIHEVGHNWFPMIVNSDERQWTWMDEGLNSFLQYLAEQEWEEDYPSRAGEPRGIVEYMRSENQVPIMTNSESILQFGPNGYFKPATALNVLRETILGRELFDFAFKTYANRWKFKNPKPADFFRTMEDASGIDLDWFWRGWFYSTDHVDLAITNVRRMNVNSADPDIEKPLQQRERDERPESVSSRRNQKLDRLVDRVPGLKDFYNSFDELDVTAGDRKAYGDLLKDLSDDESSLLKETRNFYLLDFANHGGLVMPIILDVVYEDGSSEEVRIPAEIWRRDSRQVTKMLITRKEIASVSLDPHLETADTDTGNNRFPQAIAKSRFELFKKEKTDNAMQKAAKAKAELDADAKKEAKAEKADSPVEPAE